MVSDENAKREFLLSGKNIDFQEVKKIWEANNLYFPVTPDLGTFDERIVQRVSTKGFETLRIVGKTLEEMYPERWNLDLQMISDSRIVIRGFTIHYPNVTISNSRRHVHEMEDFFTFTPMYANSTIPGSAAPQKIILGHTYGAKSTYTSAEDTAGYAHSHLSVSTSIGSYYSATPGDPFRNYSGFCEGSGPIGNARDAFRGAQNEQTFIAYLTHLAKLVSWESLEGGPHKTMDNVIARTQNIRGRVGDHRRDDISMTTLPVAQIERMTKILLGLYNVTFPDFYGKYEIHRDELGFEVVSLQNLDSILEAFAVTFKRIVSQASDPRAIIVAPSDSENMSTLHRLQSVSLDRIANLFEYTDLDITGIPVRKGVDPMRLFIRDSSEGNFVPQTDTYEDCNNVILYFRGQEIHGKRKVLGQNVASTVQKLDLDLVQNFKVQDRYRDLIEKILIDKLKKHVEINRNERPESSGELVSQNPTTDTVPV